jgi:uncharacterized protein YndB with AHSA1/START domain
MESWGKAIYSQIVEPKRIDYTDYFSDADGNENPSMPSTKVTVELIAEGNKTRLVSRGEYVSPDALKTVLDMGMLEGIGQTWDRLEEHLAKLK